MRHIQINQAHRRVSFAMTYTEVKVIYKGRKYKIKEGAHWVYKKRRLLNLKKMGIHVAHQEVYQIDGIAITTETVEPAMDMIQHLGIILTSSKGKRIIRLEQFLIEMRPAKKKEIEAAAIREIIE